MSIPISGVQLSEQPAAGITPGAERSVIKSRVPDVQPVDGWTLLFDDTQDGDGFWWDYYVARGPERDVWLDTCRFKFTPTQERFAWLVRAGFPKRPNAFSPWSDALIDAELAKMAEAA